MSAVFSNVGAWRSHVAHRARLPVVQIGPDGRGLLIRVLPVVVVLAVAHGPHVRFPGLHVRPAAHVSRGRIFQRPPPRLE
eukprot:2067154-Alexandrium_andersonii.AAC.1